MTFRSRTIRSMQLYGLMLPSVFFVTQFSLWTFVLVPLNVVLALWVSGRCQLTVATDSISYCNGLIRHTFPTSSVLNTEVAQPPGVFAFYGPGLRFISASYVSDPSKPVALGPVALATVLLSKDEKALLVQSLKDTLGPGRTQDVLAW